MTGEDALDRALDHALDELDRTHHAQSEPLSPAEVAENAAARAGDPVAIAAVDRRNRRAGLRNVLSGMSSRMMAERTARAAEAAVVAAEAGRQAIEAVASDERALPRPALHPFRTGFLGGLGLILAYITYLSLDTIRGTLIVIAVALLLAIGLDPAVNWMVRRGVHRGWAVTAVFLIMLGSLAGAVYAIIPPIVTEISTFVSSVPSLLKSLSNNQTIQTLDKNFHLIEKLQASDIGTGAAGSILDASVTAAGIAADLLIVLILSLFFLAGFPKIKAGAYRLAPASRRPRVSDLGDKILKQMGGYLGGATIVAIQAGLVAGVFAAIVGLKYPWAIGLGAAVLDFVPVIGPIIVGVSMCLLGFAESVTVGIVAGIFYLVQHLFEAYWLYPRVMRRQVNISTGTVVVAILVGGALLGVTGAVLAVPVAAAVQLIVREVLMPMQERQ